MSGEIPAIAILGPTASGKTHLALSLARQFHGEIVSCDALQIYRGMDIGTAKATEAEQRIVPHHMLDVQDPDRDFSAGDYQRMARESIGKIHERGKVPFVVGGTGFYLRALIDGLFEGPARSDELRSRMRKITDKKGAAVLHRRLGKVDPASAERISPADAERIIRAYEVYLVSGKNMTWWQSRPRDAFVGYRWLKIGISTPRELLYQKINQRVDHMYEAGLLEEARRLRQKYPRDAHAFKAIGYRQAFAYMDGEIALDEAMEETKKESRHYAKRQLTWLRADQTIVWLEGQSENLQNRAADLISDWLRVPGLPDKRG